MRETRRISSGRATIALALCAALAVPFLAGCRAEHTRSAIEQTNGVRDYLGISLPVGADFTPIVIESSPHRKLAAMVTYVDDRRDITVVEDVGEGWRPLGRNGAGITGTGGNFLQGAATDKDGNIWVLAGYTPPSNHERGYNHYLYTYDGSEWIMAGPTNGEPSGSQSDSGIGFLGGRLTHLYAGYDRDKQRNKPFLRYLDGDQWLPVACETLLRSHPGVSDWAGQALWHLVSTKNKESFALDGYRINGVASNDVSGPHRLLELPIAKLHLAQFDEAPDGTLAVVLREEKRFNRYAWHGFRLPRIGAASWGHAESLPLPSSKYGLEDLRWAPNGELVAAMNDKADAIFVSVLRDGKWLDIAKAEQSGFGMIFDPVMTFSSESAPIVTWEDFFPCGGCF